MRSNQNQGSTKCGNLKLSRHLPNYTLPEDRKDFSYWSRQGYDDVTITSHNKQAKIVDFSWEIP